MALKQVGAGLLLLGLAGTTMAQTECNCGGGGTRVTGRSLLALLAGKTACAIVGGERWQEYHEGSGSGPLIDYKLGPNHPVDPSETVGTWSIVSGSVRYDYGSGGAYEYAVCQLGSVYNFCSAGSNITGVRMVGGKVACP